MDRASPVSLQRFPSLDFGLGETLEMLRSSVQDFAAAEIAPRAAEIDSSNQFPMDLWRRMGDLGSGPASGERTTPEGAQAFWRAEIARWRPLIESAGQYAD